ncbi:MAG: hypothetical protein RLZZ546_1426 [Bacteroidota bacterium]
MKNINYTKKGFSLAEILVYVSISTMLLLTLVSFVILIKKTEKDSSDKWALERDARKIFSVVENSLIDSTKLTLPTSGSVDNQLRLTTTGSFNPTRIYLDNENLKIDRNGDIEGINSSNVIVSSFSVKNLSNGVVPENFSVNFVLSATSSDGSLISKSYSSSFTLRDYTP